MVSFDHPLAKGQEKREFAKQIQGFFWPFLANANDKTDQKIHIFQKLKYVIAFGL